MSPALKWAINVMSLMINSVLESGIMLVLQGGGSSSELDADANGERWLAKQTLQMMSEDEVAYITGSLIAAVKCKD